MLAITYKNKTQFLALAGLAVFCLLATFLLLPPKASAETKGLALSCRPNTATATVETNGRVSCEGGSAPSETVYVVSTDTKDKSTYPKTRPITVVRIDCGNVAVAKYDKGENIPDKLRCHTSKTPKVTVVETIPSSSNTDPSTCKLSDGTCASCYPVKVKDKETTTTNCIDCNEVACSDSAVECNGDRCDLIKSYVNPIIAVLSALVGLVVVLSLIIGGIQYAASEGDPQKAANAKTRLQKTVFAFVVYIFLYALLQFLIPGGIFNRGP